MSNGSDTVAVHRWKIHRGFTENFVYGHCLRQAPVGYCDYAAQSYCVVVTGLVLGEKTNYKLHDQIGSNG